MNLDENSAAKRTRVAGFVGISLFSSIGGLLLLPLYAIYLDASEYAVWALIWLVANFAGGLSNLKLDHAMRVMYFDYPASEPASKVLISTLMSSVMVVSFVFLILFLCLGAWLYQVLFAHEHISFYPLGALVLITAVLNQATAPFYSLLQNQSALGLYARLKLSVNLIHLVSQVFVITQTPFGLLGMALISLLSGLLNLVLVLGASRRFLTWNIDWSILKKACVFSGPLLLFSLLFLLEKQMDRLVLEQFLPLELVGSYALLIAIGSTLFLLYNALDSGFRAPIYQALGQAELELLPGLFERYILPGLMLSCALLVVGAYFPLFPVVSSYGAVGLHLTWLVLALLPLPLLRWQALLILYARRSRALVLTTLGKLIVNLILLLLLLPAWGLVGAILALGLSNVFNLFIYTRLLPVEQRQAVSLKPLLPYYLWLLMTIAVNWLLADHSWLWLIASAQFVGFVVWCCYYGPYREWLQSSNSSVSRALFSIKGRFL